MLNTMAKKYLIERLFNFMASVVHPSKQQQIANCDE